MKGGGCISNNKAVNHRNKTLFCDCFMTIVLSNKHKHTHTSSQPCTKVPRCLILHKFRQSPLGHLQLYTDRTICNLSLHLQHLQIVCSHIMCTVIGKVLQAHYSKDDAMKHEAAWHCRPGRNVKQGSVYHSYRWATYGYDLEIQTQWKISLKFSFTRKSRNQRDHSSHLKIKYSGEGRVA